MSQMCPNCSFDNPDDAQTCRNCPAPLHGLLGYKTKLADRYEVVSVLGFGAMGAVYLAEDNRLVGRRCAVKENRPRSNESPEVLARLREQFLAEASIMARLDHPGLPKVSDYFVTTNNREYLVMDYVEGEDLNSMLQRVEGPLPEASVLNWADQTLDALAYLHSQRPQPIIHRDIKPANLRVNLQGRVKLVDFGLVKMLDTSHPETKIELRGLGTPAYAPLEQFASSAEHTDARSDIYALGATLYHLLTNLYPPDVHQRVLNPAILPPLHQLNPAVSPRTEQVIMRAMEIHPTQRYQTADEMRQALNGQSAARPKPAKSAQASPWWFAAVGLVIVLLILVAVSWVLFGLNGGRATPLPVEGQPVSTPVEAALPAPQNNNDPTATATLVIQNIAPLGDAPGSQVEPTATPIFTPESATSSSTPTAAQPQSQAAAVLVGTIAYPVFNGQDYDLYFGQADGSGTRFVRPHASQPAFSPDGSRLAFHSWQIDARGLMVMDVSGANLVNLTNFFEDQLPTWTPDGSQIVLLSRRSGDRHSQLIKMGSVEERGQGAIMGEGEYPTIGRGGQLAFKSWGVTPAGLRLTTPAFDAAQNLTDSADDTAPAPSPNGQTIAFMSRRDGNWEIYLVKADGSGLKRLTNDPADDGLPAWSPDGKMVAFVSNRGGAWAVWAMLANGQAQRQLFAMAGSPDGLIGGDTYASRGWTEERLSWIK